MNAATHPLQACALSCIRQHVLLFSDLSFTLTSGSILLVTGPNGSGKSSLLRIMAGIAMPMQGKIFWQGRQIDNDYREQLHYIGHTNGIKLGLTVFENVQLLKAIYGRFTCDIEETLSRLQLNRQCNILAKYLSAGQKRRLALAKLLLFPKPLWILDEPLTAIDAATQQLFLSQLKLHLSTGGLAIISSHQKVSANMPMQTLELVPC